MLFDDRERTDTDSKSHVEGEWEYLDRSGRDEAQRVRTFLNRWVAQYPTGERDELIARLRSGDQKHFQSGAFELVLFALLRSLDCDVAVHPAIENGTDKHPDFLVVSPDGERAYVEAVLASEFSDAEVAAQKRVNVVLNSIDGRVKSSDFFLWVDAAGDPETPPRGRVLAAELQRWLDSLDVEQVSANVEADALDGTPQLNWEHDGWQVKFRAIPKKPGRRTSEHRPIGSISGQARIVNAWQPIRDAIRSKGGRYGELPHPLLVCVNAEALSVDRIDEMEALFGKEEYVFDSQDLGAPPQMRRQPNGAWVGPRGPQYTRVSGAWIFRSVNPWNVASKASTLYFNPWAVNTLPGVFRLTDHAEAREGSMMWTAGRSVADLLGLPSGWPE